MLPATYPPTSTTLFCINVDRFGQAEALHYCSIAIAIANITEIGGKR
jgi:hypothetical protein